MHYFIGEYFRLNRVRYDVEVLRNGERQLVWGFALRLEDGGCWPTLRKQQAGSIGSSGGG